MTGDAHLGRRRSHHRLEYCPAGVCSTEVTGEVSCRLWPVSSWLCCR